MSEPLIVPSTPAEWEGKPEEFEPRCDECGSVQDEDTTEWCGICGCCVDHCQGFLGCVTGGDRDMSRIEHIKDLLEPGR